MTWRIEHVSGNADELHASNPPERAERVARVLEISHRCVVLGSSQPEADVDRDRAASLGVAVARRRSGGGAVWLAPGDQSWIDLWLPAGDHLWVDDVVGAAFWAGAAWQQALARLGVVGAEVHESGLARSALSDLVCFAGRGPGEIFAGTHKIVGISQRRTRDWVRLQTMAYRVWEPGRLLDVLALTDVRRDKLASQLDDIVLAAGRPDSVTDAVLGSLP